MSSNILLPAAVLVVWSLVMLFWMAIVRFSAFSKAGVSLATAEPGRRGIDLEGVLPDKVNWKAHNFVHLMEQPTLFYATVFLLFLAGQGGAPLTIGLAWAYVLIRILHSIWQATVNKIPVRFGLFFASTLCLLVLAIMALFAVCDMTA